MYLQLDFSGSVRESKDVSYLSVPATSYKLLSSLVAPDKPSDEEYSHLVEKLSEHFAPTLSEIVEWFKFHT